MRRALQSFRRLPVLNAPVRAGLRASHHLLANLVSRWPVSGTVEVTYEDLRFRLDSRADDPFPSLYYYGLPYHGAAVPAVVGAFAKRSSTILDIGANTGVFSLIAALKNPSANIMAFEPYEPNYRRMRANLGLNGVTNVTPKQVALGAQAGEIEVFVPSHGRTTDTASAVPGVGERVYGDQVRWRKVRVPVAALDELELGPVDLIKCDVDGYEVEVFRGAQHLFRRSRPPVLLEIILTPESIDYFNAFAVDHGYTIYYLGGDGLTRLDELYDLGWVADFLFVQYLHLRPFVPLGQLELFVQAAAGA